MGNRPIHAALLCYTTQDDNDDSLAAVGEYAACPPRRDCHEPATVGPATSGGTIINSSVVSSREHPHHDSLAGASHNNYGCQPTSTTTTSRAVSMDDESPKSTTQTSHPEFCTSMSSETLGREARTDNSNCGCVRGGGGGSGGGRHEYYHDAAAAAAGGGGGSSSLLVGDDDEREEEIQLDVMMDEDEMILPLRRQPSSVSESSE